MRFVIVTGMSGAGKSTALNFLEDCGYYCADNLPVPLIGKFAELLSSPGSEIEKTALGVDVRTGHSFDELLRYLNSLRTAGSAARFCSWKQATIYLSSATRKQGESIPLRAVTGSMPVLQGKGLHLRS